MMRTVATASWRPTVRAMNGNTGTGADGADANFCRFTEGMSEKVELRHITTGVEQGKSERTHNPSCYVRESIDAVLNGGRF
jgi:hypothetical protein